MDGADAALCREYQRPWATGVLDDSHKLSTKNFSIGRHGVGCCIPQCGRGLYDAAMLRAPHATKSSGSYTPRRACLRFASGLDAGGVVGGRRRGRS